MILLKYFISGIFIAISVILFIGFIGLPGSVYIAAMIGWYVIRKVLKERKK